MTQAAEIPAGLLMDMLNEKNPYYGGIVENLQHDQLVGVDDRTDTQNGIWLTWQDQAGLLTFREQVQEHDSVLLLIDRESVRPALLDELV